MRQAIEWAVAEGLLELPEVDPIDVGIQYTFWGTMGFAPHEHMVKSFGWRRNLVIDSCFQLKTDVDVYNGTLEHKRKHFELRIDFTDDVAEREELERMDNRRKDVA